MVSAGTTVVIREINVQTKREKKQMVGNPPPVKNAGPSQIPLRGQGPGFGLPLEGTTKVGSSLPGQHSTIKFLRI
jgi:hypothetical protein